MTNTTQNRTWLIIFLGLLSAMAPLATDMYLPSLPAMSEAFHASTSQIQLTLTMTMAGMAIGQIVIGPLSDRFGRRRPLLICMIVFAAASLLACFAEDLTAFLALRFIQGFSGASGIVIARAISRDVCEGTELTRFFAILMMVNGLAPILAPVIGGQILLFASWRGVFALLTFVGIFQFVQSLRFTETLPQAERAADVLSSLKKLPRLLKDRYFVGHCLLQCFTFGGFFSYLAGSSFLFQEIYGVSAQVYSFIFGGIGIGIMVTGAIPARLAGRVSDEAMLQASLLVQFLASISFFAVLYLSMPITVVFPILFLTIVPLSVLSSASFSLALAAQGKSAGSASAVLGFFQMILGSAMMPLVGIAGSKSAMPMATIMLVCFLLSLIVFAIFVKGRPAK